MNTLYEIAFRVDPDSEFHRTYFEAKAEKNKFCRCAKTFFEEHGLVDPIPSYCISDILRVQLNGEQKRTFAKQLRKYDDPDGLSLFKRNSKMQSLWTSEVVNRVDYRLVCSLRYWWMPYLTRGSFALWDNGEEIYGFLSSDSPYSCSLHAKSLPDYFIEIKLSEYYAARERAEEEE